MTDTVAYFPAQVRTFLRRQDYTEIIMAQHVNALQDEVHAIERVLGTNPQGENHETVKDRVAGLAPILLPVFSHGIRLDGNQRATLNSTRLGDRRFLTLGMSGYGFQLQGPYLRMYGDGDPLHPNRWVLTDGDGQWAMSLIYGKNKPAVRFYDNIDVYGGVSNGTLRHASNTVGIASTSTDWTSGSNVFEVTVNSGQRGRILVWWYARVKARSPQFVLVGPDLRTTGNAIVNPANDTHASQEWDPDDRYVGLTGWRYFSAPARNTNYKVRLLFRSTVAGATMDIMNRRMIVYAT